MCSVGDFGFSVFLFALRKIYYCRLVRLGLWEPVHNKLCREPYKNLRVGKHSTTIMVENILQQANKHKICAEMRQFNKGKQR